MTGARISRGFAALYASETVATRRRWYENLAKMGRL